MEDFVLKTIRKLRKETPRRFLELRNACDAAIEAADAEDGSPNIPTSENFVQHFVDPFRLACESRQPRLIEIALECVDYLINHGYFRPLSPGQSESQEISSDSSSHSAFLDFIVDIIGKYVDDFDDGVQLQVLRFILTAVTSANCELHAGSLLSSIRTCFHIHLMSKNAVNRTTAKAALTQMLSGINQRMEAHDMNMKGSGEESTEMASADDIDNVDLSDNVDTTSFASVYHRDSFLVFRALCKLSMKGSSEDTNASTDAASLQNKILSLELLLHVMQNCGNAFKTGDKFIFAVRNYLCVSLLGNCTSPIAQVTGLSLQIFVSVMENFKDHLKSEIEVFISGILLKILESENSSYEHKSRVLEVFHSICRDPSALVEIFINYDCDMDAIDLFNRIVDGFAKVAKHPSAPGRNVEFISNSKKVQADEMAVRSMGLEGLIIILNSLLKSAGLLEHKTQTTEEHNSTTVDNSSEQQSLSDKTSKVTEEDAACETASGVAGQSNGDMINVVDIFDRKQRMAEELDNGILKFNLSPKKGLAYLVEAGHIEMTPGSVAKFLWQYQDRLDKTAVGDYLGREREYENGFCLKVLHEYVDAMNFEKMAFDLAIRHFLSGFRLPGEAQKIDRIMEKFAERYYLQNRDKFASADMAFILAFSTIMLQTNLHNPAIREDKRMTKEQFIKQNTGITADGEIPEEVLVEIYDRIAAQPITITQDEKLVRKSKKEDNSGFTVFQSSVDRKRKDAFSNERREMVRAGEAMFKQLTRRASSYMRKKTEVSESMYVRPMFDIAWAPILGVISQVLEVTEDATAVSSCLLGFQHAVKLACRLDVPIARDTFINSLARFTTLDTIREMQSKNVESMKTILMIAMAEKDFLDTCWVPILQCVSQIARLHLFAAGVHSDDMFFSDQASMPENKRKNSNASSNTYSPSSALRHDRSNTSSISMDIAKFFTGPSRADLAKLIEEANADIVSREISPVVLDQIFLNSRFMNEDAIIYFVRSLCDVSVGEINTSSSMNAMRSREALPDSTTPRIFSLQKLVEVADFNMDCRSRISWAKIWKLLADHFSSVGINDNSALAMYAIDSLKQLSIKFLQKEELSNFNFQRLFLKPFENIILESKSHIIKDLVIRCLDIMVLACSSNIRSGWRTIFSIFEEVAKQEFTDVASISFGIIERLMDKSFDLLIYDFVELMNCLVGFASCRHTALSMKALSYLSICADRLADGRVSQAIEKQNQSNDINNISWEKSHMKEVGEDASVFRLWWPLLLGLSIQVSNYRPEVRRKALDTLRYVLNSHGHIFSSQAWSVIFKGVLFPMMDSAKTDSTIQPVSSYPSENPPPSTNIDSWIGTMALPVLSVCQEMYFKFRDKSDQAHLLADLLGMLEDCICQDTEVLAKMALQSFHQLLIRLGQDSSVKMSSDSLDLICSKLCNCLVRNFILDFGRLGVLDFIADTPVQIVSAYEECPISKRRRSKEEQVHHLSSSSTDQENVNCSPFGDGIIMEVLPPVESNLNIPPRQCILLSWGAKLYRPTGYEVLHPKKIVASQLPWEQIKQSAMTSMVIALESIRVVSDVVSLYFHTLTPRQIGDVLFALESLYWHARSFNCSQSLRVALFDREFMKFPDFERFPHLLEQEVFSLSKILDITLKLYSNSFDSDMQSYFEPWVHRMVSLTCSRYLYLEHTLGHTEDSYDHEQHEAYGAAVLIALHGIMSFTPHQFKRFFPLFSEILTKLIICEDIDVRSCVCDIYHAHINPLVLSRL